jgi:hypothetical protein
MHSDTSEGDSLVNVFHIRPQALEDGVVRLELELLEDLDDCVQPARSLNRELFRLLFVRFDSLIRSSTTMNNTRSAARSRAFASSRSFLSASSEPSTGEPKTGTVFAIGVRIASNNIASSRAIVFWRRLGDEGEMTGEDGRQARGAECGLVQSTCMGCAVVGAQRLQ